MKSLCGLLALLLAACPLRAAAWATEAAAHACCPDQGAPEASLTECCAAVAAPSALRLEAPVAGFLPISVQAPVSGAAASAFADTRRVFVPPVLSPGAPSRAPPVSWA